MRVLRRRRGTTIAIPPDIEAAIRTGQAAEVGEWDEAELVAVGVPYLAARVDDAAAGKTAFGLLEPDDQQREAAAAADDLVAHGLARAPGTGGCLANALPGTPLEFVRAVQSDPVFLALWIRGPIWNREDQAFRPGALRGVPLPDGESVAVLEQRVDLRASRYRHVLRTPADTVEILVEMLFSDKLSPEAGPPGVDRGDPTVWLEILGSPGGPARRTKLLGARVRGRETGRLAEVRSYGLKRRQAADISADDYRQRLTELLADACRSR